MICRPRVQWKFCCDDFNWSTVGIICVVDGEISGLRAELVRLMINWTVRPQFVSRAKEFRLYFRATSISEVSSCGGEDRLKYAAIVVAVVELYSSRRAQNKVGLQIPTHSMAPPSAVPKPFTARESPFVFPFVDCQPWPRNNAPI